MPTLFRFLLVLGSIAAIGYGVVWGLATFVRPEQRDITVVVPQANFVRQP